MTLARHYAVIISVLARQEKTFVGWFTQLAAQGVLKGEKISSFFYQVCLGACVTIYPNIGGHFNAFQLVDVGKTHHSHDQIQQ